MYSPLNILKAFRRAVHGFEAERVETSKSVSATWNFEFIVDVDELDGGYVAHSNDLPGCWTQGETVQELEENIQDAVRSWMVARVDDDLDLSADLQQSTTPEPKIAFC